MKKVEVVEKSKEDYLVTVLYSPGWFKRLFGCKEKRKQFLDSGREYMDGNIKWLNFPTMTIFGRFPELDTFIRVQKVKNHEGGKT